MVKQRNAKPDVYPQPWERFHEWINCICVITFDLELGQKIEMIYPGNSRLGASEKLQICYLSFPDSNNNCSRDTSYHFRVKRSSILSYELNKNFEVSLAKFNAFAPFQMSADFLFGFVHFRQQKDPSITRGYFQKSVVLLTPLPLFNLFYYVVEDIAQNYFEAGESMIENACQQIDRWPAPIPNETLNMHLLNNFLRCKIPSSNDVFQQQIYFESRPILDPTIDIKVIPRIIQETYFYNSLKSVLLHIHQIWELVILGEPILIMASTPTQSSQLVQSIVSLIWPLKFCNNYYPYFTIHDTDFNELSSKQKVPNVVLGVTNPFFGKTLNHWPHIIRVDESNFSNNNYMLKSDKFLQKIFNGKNGISKPGFYSQHKPFLDANKTLLKKLLKVSNRPDTVQNAILRKHFFELTQNFMIPIEKHFLSLMPLQKQISPFKGLPQIKEFLFDEFLLTLNQTMFKSKIKGDLKNFYKKFISVSMNFNGWLEQKLEDANNCLRITHLEMLFNVNMNAEVLSNCGQVEIVDIVLRLKDRLNELDIHKLSERNKIKSQLKNIIESIDDELKSILLSSEALCDVFNLI